MRVDFAADLMEDAVFWVLQGHARAPEWQRERERIYLHAQAQQPRLFRALTARWWQELALGAPVERALAACPTLAATPGTVHARRALRAAEEGSELFAPDAGGQATALLLLRTQRLCAPSELHCFALEELLILDDMLDPAFGFTPELPAELYDTPSRGDAVRGRLRRLWQRRATARAAALGDGRPTASVEPATFALLLERARGATPAG